jgi:hypothetical protein
MTSSCLIFVESCVAEFQSIKSEEHFQFGKDTVVVIVSSYSAVSQASSRCAHAGPVDISNTAYWCVVGIHRDGIVGYNGSKMSSLPCASPWPQQSPPPHDKNKSIVKRLLDQHLSRPSGSNAAVAIAAPKAGVRPTLPRSMGESASYARRRGSFSSTKSTTVVANTDNVLQFLQHACPDELVPKVLALLPPKRLVALSRTNRFWARTILYRDSTWRTLCEEQYKVRACSSVKENAALIHPLMFRFSVEVR